MASSRSRSTIDIAASAPKLPVDNRFPISKYYRSADTLFRQALIYREEENFVELYINLLKFSSLVGETIPEHRDYSKFNSKIKSEFRKKLKEVIRDLEILKPTVQREIEKRNSSLANGTSSGLEITKQSEWSQVSHYQVGGDNETMRTLQDYLNSMSLNLPLPKVETLSKHSFFSQTNQKSSGWDQPISKTKVQYPTYMDTSPVEIPRLKKDKNNNGTLAELWSSHQSPALSDAGTELASQLNLIRQPSPPPVTARVQSLPSVSQSAMAVNTIPPWKVADPFPKPIPTMQDGLKQRIGPKQLYISAHMMDEFMKLARRNTEKNLETCGVLAGVLKNASFYIVALIIPKQQSTSDSCQTLNEEEIFDWQDKRNLFQLGWIHTHPKQSCFMSSIDLHTHYSYQVMLPEAIAIVMAPTDTERTSGIFRLSDPEGIKVIQNCQMRGFHPHEQSDDGSSIYEFCNHVLISSKLGYEVVDLR